MVLLLAVRAAGGRVVHQVSKHRQAEIAGIVAARPAERRSEMIEALQAFVPATGEQQVDPAAFATPALPDLG